LEARSPALSAGCVPRQRGENARRGRAGERLGRRIERTDRALVLDKIHEGRIAVDTEHHLIVTHKVTNVGTDRAQLARIAGEAKATLQTDRLEAVADRGYFSGEEIVACDHAGITVTLPKPLTSGAKSEGRFGKQDFVYLPEEDVYRLV
jgi:hypothetical protein